MFYGRTANELMDQLRLAMYGGSKIFRETSDDPIEMNVDGVSVSTSKKTVVHVWRKMESYKRYITRDDSFDLATTWSKEKYGSFIDITDPFKKRTSARIDFGFKGSIEDIGYEL